MADLETVANAIAAQLETIDGLQVYIEPPGTVDTPAVIVELGPINYDSAMDRGSDDATWILNFLETDSTEGIRNIYKYLNGTGTRSVKECFERNPTLDGTVMYAVVTDSDKPDRAEVGQGEFYRVPVNLMTCMRGES